MRQRILLVDDHAHYLSSLRQMIELSIPGVSIITAGDGSNGLLLARRQPFDLIMLDYRLPALSGSDVVRQLRIWSTQTQQKLPPIILTSTQPDVAVFARALRVAAFLPKPVLSEHVEQTIIPLLRQSGAEQAATPRLWRVEPRSS